MESASGARVRVRVRVRVRAGAEAGAGTGAGLGRVGGAGFELPVRLGGGAFACHSWVGPGALCFAVGVKRLSSTVPVD